jgi:plasmid stabilization system protein ParE
VIRPIELLPRARQQLFEAARWWRDHRSAEQAARWLAGMQSTLAELESDAERFPLAAEAEAVGVPIRQIHFGLSHRPTHWIVFEVEDDRVVVHAIRHLAQGDLTPEDVP